MTSRTAVILEALVVALGAASYTVEGVIFTRPQDLVVNDHPILGVQLPGTQLGILPRKEVAAHNTASGVSDQELVFDVELQAPAPPGMPGYRALDALRTWVWVATYNAPAFSPASGTGLLREFAKVLHTEWDPPAEVRRHSYATACVRMQVRHRIRNGDPTRTR